MDTNNKIATISNSLNCTNCGSILHYEPGTRQLKCGHCGTANDIESTEGSNDISPYDYDGFVEYIASKPAISDLQSVKCGNCGSVTVLSKDITASSCSFCASPLILEFTDGQVYVKPHYILPFMINEQVAKGIFSTWIKKLKFAPDDLAANISSSLGSPLDGIYLPYWAFDADAVTNYEGKRGNYYWETEYYTETIDGKEVSRSRQVRHTEWTFVSNTITNNFRDVLIAASKSLPQKTLNAIGFWELKNLVEYNEGYVSGFKSENYQTAPPEALEAAKKSMIDQINGSIMADIGGDEQKIIDLSSQLNDIGIKYILMPVWINSFNYKGKIYHFVINACNGMVTSERPYSAKKIALLVLIILAALAVLFFLSYLANKPH